MGTKHLGLGLAALAALATSALAGAPAGAAPSEHASVRAHQVTADERSEGYWTSERMRNAVPGSALADRALQRGTTTAIDEVARGLHERVEATAAPLREKGKPASKSSKSLHADEAPVPHIGKVFFTLGGQNYVCSANAVASANRATVSTAGHCMNEGPGAFATNFVFVPAYRDGAAPYGQWSAEALYAPSQWVDAGNMAYDTGFAVVAPEGGQELADVVGASGVEFNASRGQAYKAFGYPAARPFDGQGLVSCSGRAADDPYNPQFNSQGIPCDMTGGSSGGPWFLGTSSSGYQNSVNSYGYGSRSTTMYGPYWGSVIQNTYQTASQG